MRYIVAWIVGNLLADLVRWLCSLALLAWLLWLTVPRSVWRGLGL